MKIGICDDEKKLRTSMRKVIGQELQLLGLDYRMQEYGSGEELLKNIKEQDLDILFLDIEMEGINGMETAKELRRQYKNMIIIFVTAYPDFVFQGYEVRALHYILKPYKEAKIKEVLHMALKELDDTSEKYFLIEQKSGMRKLRLTQVHYFKSDKKKITAVMEDRNEEFYGKLSELEEKLPDYFIRSHNRYLLNLNYVISLESSYCLCGKEEIPVSRGCRQNLAVAFAQQMLH